MHALIAEKKMREREKEERERERERERDSVCMCVFAGVWVGETVRRK